MIFLFISVRYTITDFQTPETLYYVTRRAKWSDVKNFDFQLVKMWKMNFTLNIKIDDITDVFLNAGSSTMKEYTNQLV